MVISQNFHIGASLIETRYVDELLNWFWNLGIFYFFPQFGNILFYFLFLFLCHFSTGLQNNDDGFYILHIYRYIGIAYRAWFVTITQTTSVKQYKLLKLEMSNRGKTTLPPDFHSNGFVSERKNWVKSVILRNIITISNNCFLF